MAPSFGVSIHPVFRNAPCATMREEEARGLMGFHYYVTCPDCRQTPECFEAWGENGHRQGSVPMDGDLAHWMTSYATHHRGQTRFTAGAAIYYREG